MRRILAATILALISTGSSYTEAASEAVEGKPFMTGSAPMLRGENGYKTVPLLTVGDTVSAAAPGSAYTPVGILDGIGATKIDATTIRIFVNHEVGPHQGALYKVSNGQGGEFPLQGARISYFDIDSVSKAIKQGGVAYSTIYDAFGRIAANNDFAVPFRESRAGPMMTPDSDDGFNRFCSGSLYEANTFGASKGLTQTIYFAGEEVGGISSAAGGHIWALDVASGALWAVPAMGRGAWENVTEVDTGDTARVAFVLSDDTAPFDAGGDADLERAPLYLYVGEKSTAPDANFVEKNGLANGKLYAWLAEDAGLSVKTFKGNGAVAKGKWVEIDNRRNPEQASGDGSTGFDKYGYPTQRTLWLRAKEKGAFEFTRPEDLHTNPANGTQIVLSDTGNSSSANKDGTVYTMDLNLSDQANPAGILRILYDSNADPAKALRNPDNVVWSSDGFIYVQEDRATDELFTAADRANKKEASIIRIDPATGEVMRVAEIDRSAVAPAGSLDTKSDDIGNWESSGILDVSQLFGLQGGSLFLADIQAHSITDGMVFTKGLVRGGQLLYIAAPGLDITRVFPAAARGSR
jgi:secreted PhoX family phosphatase